MRRRLEEQFRADRAVRRPDLARLAHGADRQLHRSARPPRRSEPFMRQVFIGRDPALDGRPGVRAQALRHPQARLQRDPRLHAWTAPSTGTCRACRYKTIVYKGMLMTEQVAQYFTDLHEPGDGDGAGAGALALQHQHLPELGPRASVPLHRAQRRDQHAARQHQLDACPRGAVRVRRCSATTSRRSCRSSTRTAATRRCSTTRSNCWCWPAARCRTR